MEDLTQIVVSEKLDVPFKEFTAGQVIQSKQFNDDMVDVEDKINEVIDKHNTIATSYKTHNENQINPHQVTAHQTGTYDGVEIDSFVSDLKNGNLNDNSVLNRILADGCVQNRNISDGIITVSKVESGFGSQINISQNIEITDRYTKTETDALVQSKVGDGTYDKATIDGKLAQVQAGVIVDKSLGIEKFKDNVGTLIELSQNPQITGRYTKAEVNGLITSNFTPKDYGKITEAVVDGSIELPDVSGVIYNTGVLDYSKLGKCITALGESRMIDGRWIEGELITSTDLNSMVDDIDTNANSIIELNSDISDVIASLASYQFKTDNSLTTNSKSLIGAINELKTHKDSHYLQINDINIKNLSQDNKIATLESYNTNTRLYNLENINASTRLSNIEAKNSAQDTTLSANVLAINKLSSNQTFITNAVSAHSNTLNTLIVKNSEQDVELANIESTIISQKTKLNTLDEQFRNLVINAGNSNAEIATSRGRFSYLPDRLDHIENEVSSVSVNVEGSYATVVGSVGSNITNIEVLGNTIQGISDLSDIQSVGTLQEDGRYKMSILSCGKNFTNPVIQNGMIQGSNGLFDNGVSPDYCSNVNYDYIKPTKQYFISSDKTIDTVFYYDKDRQYISNQSITSKSKQLIIPSNSYYIRYRFLIANKPNWVQIEEGTQATSYEPYQENKSSILLPCQLEKAGDVADRLFRREDGVWCVEKNVGEVTLNGSESGWINDGATTNTIRFKLPNTTVANISGNKCISNMFLSLNYNQYIDDFTVGILNHGASFNIKGLKTQFNDSSTFKTWLSQNPTLVKYQLATPQIIELPLDVQIQLNSFNGVTNIFTEDTVIEPTIKATVPKSLGASVQSLVNKTDILSDRVEAVETLKEGSELEVTTESGYVVCENSNNGQIEGLKVEGNTLVNLVVLKSGSFSYSSTSSAYIHTGLRRQLTSGKYTLITNITENTLDKVVSISLSTSSGIQYPGISFSLGATGIQTKLLNITTEVTNIRLYADNTTTGKVNFDNIIVLEGDHTQNPPSYFEGLKSVGDTSDTIEVLSRKEDGNIFDNDLWELGFIGDSTGAFSESTQYLRTPKLNVIPNTTYKFEGYSQRVYYYDKTGNYISLNVLGGGTFNKQSSKFTTPINCHYIALRYEYKNSVSVIASLEDMKKTNSTICKYENTLEFKQNKKQILYQNSTGTYEKPILRSTGSVSDTIEKHSDGKYYFHKRCGEVVLSGGSSEIISISKTNTNTMLFSFPTNSSIKGGASSIVSVCSNFKCDTASNQWATDEENCAINNNGQIIIAIQKTKLITQDIQGFKTWLQSNPTTVVYQLATEEVYECVNLDLDSYEGETSVIVNSGAISPKLTFKIASHIANTIQVLKDRINYLEDKVINMFKAVLSGDVQTLAYELYPEDFEEEKTIETVEGTELL